MQGCSTTNKDRIDVCVCVWGGVLRGRQDDAFTPFTLFLIDIIDVQERKMTGQG